MEVSRYRPSLLAWACVLATLFFVAVAAVIDSSNWVPGVGEAAFEAGIACVTAAYLSRQLRESVREKLADAQPLPLGAVDVSDSGRDVFLFGACLFALFAGETAVLLLLHRDAATAGAIVAGASAGIAAGAVFDSRTIRRWEAGHGRIYTEGRSGIRRKGRLYVEDPAAAPLDAS